MADQERQAKLSSNKAQTWEYIQNRFIWDFGDRHFKMIELLKNFTEAKCGFRYSFFCYDVHLDFKVVRNSLIS